MPTTLKPCLYGEKKNITLDKFNPGNLTKAVTFDLEEYGQKGVQGLPLKMTDVNRLVEYEKKRMKKPYVRAGIIKNDLVVTINDAADTKLEGMAVLCKDYVGIKAKLAKNSASVVNIEPDPDDKVIPGAAKAQANKRGVKVEKEELAAFGKTTGDIVLCAHGAPKTKPGRVIGDELGEMSAKDIVKYLTGSKDAKKRLGTHYAGTVWLSGCFTASGGPEASKQDDAMAKKVHDMLKKAGWEHVSVVGMPGPSITYRGKDKVNGKSVKTGDKSARHGMTTDAAIKAFYKKADPIYKSLEKAYKKYDGTPEQFFADPKVKPIVEKYQKVCDEMDEIKKMNDAGTYKQHIAKLEGRFGLRNLEKELANVK